MRFIKTPLTYDSDSSNISRTLEERISRIDNFIELIIFTPRGSFLADDDFGFEYWNQEYSNVHFRSFNSGQNYNITNGLYSEVTLKECKDSIEKSLKFYEPQLKRVEVSVELSSVSSNEESGNKLLSKYKVTIIITGMLNDGLDTMIPYRKEVKYLMEPTVKRVTI